MNFDIDLVIVATFLVTNVCVGIYYGRNIKTLRYYAIGNRSFSTATITSTIIATWIGAGFFSSVISETYQNGLWHIVSRFGDFLTLWIVGIFFAPRIGEFFGKITVAEIMYDLYGQKVRIVTAIASIALAVGYVAVQIKVFSILFSHFFNISNYWAVLISSLVIIIYAAFGGILSIIFTDVIQFVTFCIFVPVFTLFLWTIFGSSDAIINVFQNNSLFDYKKVFDYHDRSFYISMMLLLYFTLPALDPATCQRILIAKNIRQVRKSFINASIICLIICIMGFFIAIIALSHNPDMNPDNLLVYVVDNYSFVGLKGFVLISIMAMGMSTADSYINVSSVIFTNDICKPFNISVMKNELLLTRITTVIIGLSAILLVLFSNSLFELLLLAGNFYTPIITVPLTLAIFGFRSTPRAVLIGMFSALIVVIVWRTYIQSKINIDSIIPGTIANLVTLIFTHYFFKEVGGWVGIKYPNSLIALRLERKRKFQNLIQSIKEFSILNACKNNLPKQESTYSLFAIFVIIVTYSSLFSIEKKYRIIYQEIYYFIYHSVLILSIGFLTYPIWKPKFKNQIFIAITWSLGIFYLLIWVSIMLIIISEFHYLQLMVLIINLLVTGILLRWQSALFISVIGMLVTIQFAKYYYTWTDSVLSKLGDIEFPIIYILLLFSSVLTIFLFLKPQQQIQEISEYIINYLNDDNKQKQLKLIKVSQYREEFVNRLDRYCIGIFKLIHQQINNLDQELQKKDIESLLDKEQMIKIIDRLKAGAKYLDHVISQVQEVKIHPIKVNFEQFIYDIIDQYKNATSHYDLEIITDFKTNIKEIEIDQQLIKSTLMTFINHGVTNSSITNISISVYDTQLEYNVNNPMKIRRDAVTLSIIIDNVTLTQQDVNLMLQPTFNTINELNFVEMHQIITAHYGKINISLDNFGQVIYAITIPSRLKEIRPKKMDLLDKQLDSIKTQNIQMINKNNDMLRNIAKQLIDINMDFITIARITKLTLEELQQLDTKD